MNRERELTDDFMESLNLLVFHSILGVFKNVNFRIGKRAIYV